MKALYKQQGERLYKIVGNMLIEVNLESYDYGIIGLCYADKRRSILWPNKYATRIRKAVFDKYFNEAIKNLQTINNNL